jgi:hypothetical protein
MCNRLDEDGGHLFLKCKKVKPVWRSVMLEDIRVKLLSAPSSKAMFEMILELPKDKQVSVLVLMWDWWTVRNKKNAEGKDSSTMEVCCTIQRHLIDFTKVTAAPAPSLDQQPKRWAKPRADHVKVNFDASFLRESNDGAWGFVV